MDDHSGSEQLQDVLVRHGYNFETVPLQAQVAAVADALDLAPWFVELHSSMAPSSQTSIPWTGNSLELFSFADLPTAQAGYRFSLPDQLRDPDWLGSWIVVGHSGGDVFFVDTSILPGSVFFARHGAGSWSTSKVAESYGAFLRCLARFESVLLDGFDMEIWSDDGEIRDDFRAAVGDHLMGLLDDDLKAAFLGAIFD